MSKRRTITNAVMLAVFATFCIVAMEWLAFNIGQPKPGFLNSSYRLTAYFKDADGLPTSADVRVSGVVVGKVISVSKDDQGHPGTTKVNMDIADSNAVVHRNATAKVRPKTLLGEKFVDLNLGSGPPTSNLLGSEPIVDTSTTIENDTIFNSFDKPTREQQKVVLAQLDKALQGRAGDVQMILPQLDEVVHNLAPLAKLYEKDQPVVDQIFANLDTVMATLADEHVRLGSFLHNGNVALSAINSRDNALITTLRQVSQFDERLNRVVSSTVEAQHQGIDKLSPTIDSQHAFIAAIVYPQSACGGRPCGVTELLTGTLLGQINYPSDQLTVTSGDGEKVTNQWDSMFSQPADSYRHPGGTHSAQNIVLSEHCDTVQTTLQPLLGIDPSGTLGKTVLQACAAMSGHPKPASGPADFGSATTAAMLATLSGQGT